MSCNICCDNYNKSTRTKICCPYCEFDVCRTCCETYILSESVPKCMKPDCAKEWSRKFLRENLTFVFLNLKYKEHLEDLLFDQEKALMPATQPFVEEKIYKKNISKEIKEINDIIISLNKQKKNLEYKLNYGVTKYDKEEKSHRFVRQCPAANCRGFLSTQWKCGICEQWSCPECHELKGTNRDCEHTCDPNSVETAKLLAKDSKPCPKCQSMIFKIEGCDQMWCTQCHTAFSWKTGKLENNIHNPHFYEWQRSRNKGAAPRNPLDIECGRDLTNYTVDRIYEMVKKYPDLYKTYQREVTDYRGRKTLQNTVSYSEPINRTCLIIRNIIHNMRVELPTFQTNYVERNQDLRIKYLENLISENEFKILIQRNDKKNKKNMEIAQILQLSNTAVTDIVYRLIDHLKNDDQHIDSFIIEFEEIINYCNNIFKDISFTYNTICYKFDERFNFTRVEKEKKIKKEDDDTISKLEKAVDNL
jgi:hypothetical protein